MKDKKEIAKKCLDYLYLLEDIEEYKENEIGEAINYIQNKYINNIKTKDTTLKAKHCPKCKGVSYHEKKRAKKYCPFCNFYN